MFICDVCIKKKQIKNTATLAKKVRVFFSARNISMQEILVYVILFALEDLMNP